MKTLLLVLVIVSRFAFAEHDAPSGGRAQAVPDDKAKALAEIADNLGVDIDWGKACTSLKEEAAHFKEADFPSEGLYLRCLTHRVGDQFFIMRSRLRGQGGRIGKSALGKYEFGGSSKDAPPEAPPKGSDEKAYDAIKKKYDDLVEMRANEHGLKDIEVSYLYLRNLYHDALVRYLETIKLSSGFRENEKLLLEVQAFGERLLRDCPAKVEGLPHGLPECASNTQLKLFAARYAHDAGELEKLHAIAGIPKPSEKTIEGRTGLLKQRLELYQALCTKGGKILTDDKNVPIVVEDGEGHRLDCGAEAGALKGEVEELGVAKGEDECTKDESERKNEGCLKEMGCNALRSAMNLATGPLGPMVRRLSGFDKLVESKAPDLGKCIKSNQTDCMSSLVSGILNNLWSTIKGLWDLAKLAVNGVKDLAVAGWNWLFDIEDKSSDAAQAAATQSPGAIKMFLTDPIEFIKKTAGAIYESATKFIREDFMCAEWSGTPHASTCTKPATSWACADCNQRTNAICGVVGVLASEIIAAYFTGGASTAIGKGAAVVGTKIAATGAKLAAAGAAIAKTFPILSKVGKGLALAGKGLSTAARAAIKAVVDSQIAKTIVATGRLGGAGASTVGKIAADLASPITGAVVATGQFTGRLLAPVGQAIVIGGKTVTWPIRRYFGLMDEAFKLGGAHATQASAIIGKYFEKSQLVARVIPRSQVSTLASEALGGRTLDQAQRKAAVRAAAHGDGKLGAEVLAEKAKMLVEGKVAKDSEEAMKILEKWYAKGNHGAPAPKLPTFPHAEGRAAAAEKLLDAKLTAEQQKAVEAAHRVGVGEKGASGGPAAHFNYTPAQLKEKARLLEAAGFTKEQREALLRSGICGRTELEAMLSAVEFSGAANKTVKELAAAEAQQARATLQKIRSGEIPLPENAINAKGAFHREPIPGTDFELVYWAEREGKGAPVIRINRERTLPMKFGSIPSAHKADVEHWLNKVKSGTVAIEKNAGVPQRHVIARNGKDRVVVEFQYTAKGELEITRVGRPEPLFYIDPKPVASLNGGRRAEMQLDKLHYSQATVEGGVPEIAANMLKHGFDKNQPLKVVRFPDGTVVSLDHRRAVAARLARIEDVPVIVYESTSPIAGGIATDSFKLEVAFGKYKVGAVPKTWEEAVAFRSAGQRKLGDKAFEKFPIGGSNKLPRMLPKELEEIRQSFPIGKEQLEEILGVMW